MKVYTIEEDLQFSRSRTEAIFSTRKKAEAVAQRWSRRDKMKYRILEWELDVST